jgi:putative NIF3 family GTP cyclohydrolase 1 type 2
MPTVQAVIDTILTAIPNVTLPETVDTLKAGDPAQEVTGIVTTFMPTCAVLQRAIDLGANLIIPHEPLFYNHPDRTDWLTDDPVYRAKRKLIEDHGLAVWRFHDYWHRHQPDGIVTGVVEALGWADYYDPDDPYLIQIPLTPFGDLVAYVKRKLGAHRALVIGQSDMPCSNIALLVGFGGGARQIEALGSDIDVLITGETFEWETPEYVRDAIYLGRSKALIVTGHQVSEEAGMAYLVEWLRPRLPGVTITHVPSGDPFPSA